MEEAGPGSAIIALLIIKGFQLTGSDGNVYAPLKQTLPCDPPEQLCTTSGKILHFATLARFLHLSEQELCVWMYVNTPGQEE